MSNITLHKSRSKFQSLRRPINLLLVVCGGAAIYWGLSTYFNLDKDVYTNDAQIEEYINPVNARIRGYIKKVNFDEHQHINEGDTLILIDDSEYKIQLKQAEALYQAAEASKTVTSSTVNTISSNLVTSDANIKASKAKLWNAEQNYKRFKNLLDDGAATQQQFDQVKTDYETLFDQTTALEKQKYTTGLTAGESSKKIRVNLAEIKAAEAGVELAKLNLSYTVITAPYSGVTGKRIVQEGQLIEPGQNLLSFVRDNNKWVEANYMETQIANLHIGQEMRLKIDGLGGKIIYGKIVAISQATGSKYSGIPVDNATGNFVKVRQRIPVKIALTPSPDQKGIMEMLRAGMNVEVTKAN